MQIRIVVLLLALTAVLFVTQPANTQDLTGHWGVQGDAAWVSVPKSIVEKIHALPEKPDVSGFNESVGLVRFNKKAAPSYAFQFSNLRASIEGTQLSQFQRRITGAGTIRGFMATKYLNFVTRKRVSAGLAFGGGVGQLNAHYVRSTIVPNTVMFASLKQYQHIVPTFEMLARVDFQPERHLTVGPFYGIRNGTLAAGLALRIHFVR
jgi:hypothetical protein